MTTSAPMSRRDALTRPGWVKVPEIAALFWVTKILTTAMGETTSGTLVHQVPGAVAVLLGFVVFVCALVIQFRAPRYVPWIYWFAVVMVSVFGTMAADVTHVALALVVIVRVWYRTEGTLSIHGIDTPRREIFYWAAVLATFALGTAAGDMTAKPLHLGYLASGIAFAVLIVIPWIAWARFGLNAIVAFWIAYALTRPHGASYADWLGVSPARGGLGWGTGPVSVTLTLLIVVCVLYIQRAWARERDARWRILRCCSISVMELSSHGRAPL